jgi:hypothetical protein
MPGAENLMETLLSFGGQERWRHGFSCSQITFTRRAQYTTIQFAVSQAEGVGCR